MTKKELRKSVIEFLINNNPDADVTQNTGVLLKRAEKLGFVLPEENSQKPIEEIIEETVKEITEPSQELPEEPSQELPEEPSQEIPEENLEEFKVKKRGRPKTKKEPETFEAKVEQPKQENDNAVLWVAAIAIAVIAIIYLLKRFKNTENE
jgi:hypothetical protein